MKQMIMDNPMMNKKMDPNSLRSNMMMMKNMESMMHTMQLIMDQMMPMEDTSSMM